MPLRPAASEHVFDGQVDEGLLSATEKWIYLLAADVRNPRVAGTGAERRSEEYRSRKRSGTEVVGASPTDE